MSIQRWSAQSIAIQWHGTDLRDDEYVTYDEHAAALVAARDRGYSEAMDDGWGEPGHIKAAVADALDAVREALELLPVSLVDTRFDPDDERHFVQAVRLTTALTAIDNLRGAE